MPPITGDAPRCGRLREVASGVLLALSLAALIVPGVGRGAEPLVLENARCRVEVDSERGGLLRLLDREGNIDLRSPEGMAENFRLLLPVPGEAPTFVYGKDQRLSRVESFHDGLRLCWDGPLKDAGGGGHDISATMTIELQDRSFRFHFGLTNGTRLTIQEVWYPAIGGLLAFGPPDSRGEVVLNPPPHNGKRLRKPFGQHLVGYPSQNMGFVEVDNLALRRGLYLGAHDSIDRFKAFYFVEQNRGESTDVSAWLIHYPFSLPGTVFEGAPLVVAFHEGDWVAGGKEMYRPWFIETFGLRRPAEDWIRQHSFYQMIMIMLPEGNVNYTIRQIPLLARDGLKYGLSSLQIAGWQFGGHDNGYPYYEPDPRLGTWGDLKWAIRECHRLGVKIYFFANIHVNNLDTEWYQRELKDYDFEMRQGHPDWLAAWGMGTLGSRMGLTAPVMAMGDPSFPGMADGHLKYFKRLASIGADGLHIDKSFPRALNFNPRIVLSPDQSPWAGTMRLVERIDRECRAIHPDFRLSFETAWDRTLSFGAATWWAGNMSNARRIFPELVETVGLYQPYDYLGVNDAVRNAHAVMVAPFHFNRSMDDPAWRGLAAYIREVKQVRDQLADYVFTGERLEGKAALFHPQALPAGIEHAVYRNLNTGNRACILTHRGSAPATVGFAGFGGTGAGQVQVFRPGQAPVMSPLPAQIRVDPERIVFLVEP